MRTLGIVGSTLVMAVLAIACSAPESTKTPLVVCTAGEKGCPQEKSATVPKPGTSTSSSSSGGPTGTPTKADPDDPPNGPKKQPTTAADAGSEDPGELPPEEEEEEPPPPPPPPPLGPICSKLEECCNQLIDQGYDPATCHSMVDTRNENACSLQRKAYTDYGDCTL